MAPLHLCSLFRPPVPLQEDFASLHDVDCPARGGLVMALLPPPHVWGAAPDLVEFTGTSQREGRGGWLPMARLACTTFGGCCGARTVWSSCVLQCALLGLAPLLVPGGLFLLGWLHACFPAWCSLPFGWCTHRRCCALWERRCVAPFLLCLPLGCPDVVWGCKGHAVLVHMAPNLQSD